MLGVAIFSHAVHSFESEIKRIYLSVAFLFFFE
jgi:hypothetical protein